MRGDKKKLLADNSRRFCRIQEATRKLDRNKERFSTVPVRIILVGTGVGAAAGATYDISRK